MRPVNRGLPPVTNEGDPVELRDYQQAAPHLRERLGWYCSFCERMVPVSLAVEHVLPKSLYPERRLDWDNFLLACANCNSTKGDKDTGQQTCFWPDRANTFRAFRYEKGRVLAHPDRSSEDQQCAKRTLELFGLDKITGTSRDRRWIDRQRAWDLAERSLMQLKSRDTAAFRELVVDNAKEQGHWSCWYTVFAEDEDMLNRLLRAFPGTDAACFDSRRRPVRRPGGVI
jgi:uncharacterized protein (TIGR02646 family)